METKRITLKEIFMAISLSNVRDKAIISLISSSGMKMGDLYKLTIKDALISCNVDSIDSLFKINTSNTIPCWKIKTGKRKQKMVCSTPESLFYIVTYLKERSLESDLVESDLLFVNSAGGSIESHDPAKIFTKHNEILHMNNPHLEKFSSENVRKFFEDICRDYLYIKASLKQDLINMFMNGVSGSNLFKRVSQEELIDIYKEIIPFLTAKYYDSYYYNEYTNDNVGIEKIVHDYYNKIKTDDFYADVRLCDIAFNIAKYKKFEFSIDDKYLNVLFKLSKIKLILLDSKYSNELYSKSIIPKKSSLFEKERKIYKIMTDLGIVELFDDRDIYNNLSQYIYLDKYYSNHFITGKECCEIIEFVSFDFFKKEMEKMVFRYTH